LLNLSWGESTEGRLYLGFAERRNGGGLEGGQLERGLRLLLLLLLLLILRSGP
jgi:hypothetical protein